MDKLKQIEGDTTMKTSHKYHERKYLVIQTINSLWFRHGHGLDLEIQACHMSFNVKLTDFDNGRLYGSSSFSVNLLAGDGDTVVDLAERKMEKALKVCGAEFTSIRDFLKE